MTQTAINDPITPTKEDQPTIQNNATPIVSPKAKALAQKLSSDRKRRQDVFDVFDPTVSIEVERQLFDLTERRRESLLKGIDSHQNSPLFNGSAPYSSTDNVLAKILMMDTNNKFVAAGLYCATKHWTAFGLAVLVLFLRRRLLAPSLFRKTLGILGWLVVSLKVIPWTALLIYLGYLGYQLYRSFTQPVPKPAA